MVFITKRAASERLITSSNSNLKLLFVKRHQNEMREEKGENLGEDFRDTRRSVSIQDIPGFLETFKKRMKLRDESTERLWLTTHTGGVPTGKTDLERNAWK